MEADYGLESLHGASEDAEDDDARAWAREDIREENDDDARVEDAWTTRVDAEVSVCDVTSRESSRRSNGTMTSAHRKRARGFEPLPTPRAAANAVEARGMEDLSEGDEWEDWDGAVGRSSARRGGGRRGGRGARRTRGGAARAFARRTLGWSPSALRVGTREAAREGALEYAREMYASLDAWYAACEELAYEEARAAMSQAMTSLGEPLHVVATRVGLVGDGLMEIRVRFQKPEKIRSYFDAGWRRPWTMVVLRDASGAEMTALVAADHEAAASSDCALWVREQDFPEGGAKEHRVKMFPLVSLLVHQRMVCASVLRTKVAFAHQLIGHKRATHTIFADSEEDVEENRSEKNCSDGTRSDAAANDELNASQRRAMEKFMHSSHAEKLQMVQGPPGCGKTHFVVALLNRLMDENQRVMVCAPSNKALCVAMELYLQSRESNNDDSVVLVGDQEALSQSQTEGRTNVLSYHVLNKYRHMVGRLKDAMNKFEQGAASDRVDELLINICDEARFLRKRLEDVAPDFSAGEITDALRSLEEQTSVSSALELGAQIMSVISEDSISARGDRIDEFWREVLGRARIIFCTLASAGQSICQSIGSLDVLLVDEAAQALEPELAIPLMLSPRKLLLVGDPAQLGPTLSSDIARRRSYDRSVMSRLFNLDDSRVSLLDTQYRMHPHISRWPAEKFYDGELKNSPHVISRALPPGFPKWLPPYVFIDSITGIEQGARGQSRWNFREASLVCDVIKAIQALSQKTTNTMPTFSIVVISFYRAQAHKIRDEMCARGIKGVLSHTVDSFQGSEADVVICSTVRSNNRARIGFLADKRRLNVALTRARHSLVLIGRAHTLSECESEEWRSIVQDAHARNAWMLEDDVDAWRR